jgi:alpha-D-xyloside xylohydrolase
MIFNKLLSNSKKSFLLAFIVLTASPLSIYGQIKKMSNGIVITVPQGHLKLQVCTDDIVRVLVSTTDTFSNRKSLMMVENPWKTTPFKVSENSIEVELTTTKLKVKVAKQSGAVSFYDINGKLILAEREDRKITPIFINNEHTWSIRQQWVSPKDEVLHGLGHHQNGIFNIRDANIDLWQENWEVVVPFITSNKGYGILWDNYSHTRWGFPVSNDYIDPQLLFDKDGKPGGLTGKYFNGNDFSDLKATHKDSIINFDFKTFGPQVDNSFTTDPDWVSKPLNPEINSKKFSVRWEGQIKTLHGGEYNFNTFCTQSIRLYINGEMVVDGWNTTDIYLNKKIKLAANTKYDIRIDWVKDDSNPLHQASNGAIQVRWGFPVQESYDGLTLWSEVADNLDYYFIYGPDQDHIINGYRTATGKVPLFGKYAYGYWHSHINIQSQKDYLDLIKEFRNRKIPIDILVQDLDYWAPEEWGSHHFNPQRYPNPTEMINQAHQMKVKYMISVWGMFQKGSDNWKELMDKKLLFRYNNCSFWTDKGTWYYNPFSPQGRQVYWDQMNKNLFSKGVDGWWLDASEPEISTPADPFLYKKVMDNNLGTGARYLNAYSLMQSKGIYEGQRLTAPDKRALILTRSSFAGQQAYGSVVWTGDIAGTWDVFRKQIKCGLNYSLSGLPYWTTDIGGFFINQPDWPLLNQDPGYRELYTRWFQFGVFCPILRTHGCGPRREMWLLGEQSMNTQIKFDNLRYRLMPYIYSVAGKVTHQNYTIMRALTMDFREDAKVGSIWDQYMFGPAFLACPVVEAKAVTRKVYLPGNSPWIDFWTGEQYKGGQEIRANAALETMPLFVKAGSIVPMGQFVQFASERPNALLEIRVYPGANGSFNLYEDEGETYNYEKGNFSIIAFYWDDAKHQLTIGKRKGSYTGMASERKFQIVLVTKNNGNGIELSPKANKTITYKGNKQTIKL